jgi:hypothetical protein
MSVDIFPLREMWASFEGWMHVLSGMALRVISVVSQVVAGVIGHLQPRFHAHGAVMAHAQKLEAACISGSVLISPEMARILQIRTTPDQDANKGLQIPFPVVEHFFPPTQESVEVDPSSSIAGTSCLGIFLRVTGFALPEVDQQVQRKRNREKRAERQVCAFLINPARSRSAHSTARRLHQFLFRSLHQFLFPCVS